VGRSATGRSAVAVRVAAVGVGVAVAGSMLASCVSTSAMVGRSSPPPSRTGWLLTQSALADLQVDPVARALLRRSQLSEILRPGQSPVPGFDAGIVAAFPSASALMAAITGGQLPPGTSAVLYDPETWAFTPEAEQRTVVEAARRAAALAHAHGLRFVVAPGLDLTAVLAPAEPGPRWRVFLALRLAASLAATADVIDLQAQSLERNAGAYSRFVVAAAAQARAANPAIRVLAGLSTNPPGPPVTARELTAAATGSLGALDGYWLNIPARGQRCPSCGPASPQLGIALLRALWLGLAGRRTPSAGHAARGRRLPSWHPGW
jgi:hypothetical protein